MTTTDSASPAAATFRLATPPDEAALYPLYAEFHDELARLVPTEDDLRAAVGALLERRQVQVYLAEREGRAIGYTALRGVPGTGRATVEDVFVVPEARRQGLGGRLLRATLADARQRGFGEIILDTAAENLGAQRLYESLDFVVERAGASDAAGMRRFRLDVRA